MIRTRRTRNVVEEAERVLADADRSERAMRRQKATTWLWVGLYLAVVVFAVVCACLGW